MPVVGLLALATAAAAAQQPPPRDVGIVRSLAAPPGIGSIVGRVIDAVSGEPVRRVEVMAIHIRQPPVVAYTGDDGRFELIDLEAGVWQIAAAKAGYVRQMWGQRRPSDRASPIAVAPGVSVGADFALVRAGAIGGRVYDEYGEPLAGVKVDVLRPRMSRHKRYLQPVGIGDLTDDTGAFRVHGLPAGEYFVTVSLRVAPVESVVQTTYSPTYYPGTGSFAEAQRVVVAPGADVSLDFPVAPHRTARVAGIVVAASGSPADAYLNLAAEGAGVAMPLGIGGATLPDGTFTIPDVPPGTYTLAAELKGQGSGTEVAVVPLTVHGDDVSGITLVTAPPATMKGSIVADAGVDARLPDTVSVLAISLRSNGDPTFAEPADNAFDLTVPVGPFRLLVEPPDGWVVKSILMGDADATDAVLDLQGARAVPVRVVLSNRVSSVRGTVRGADGRGLAAGATVVVFPSDSARWQVPSRFLRTAVVANDGTFSVAGLPPATGYLAVAVDGLEEGEGEDPEFLARVVDLGVRFDLAEGQGRVVDLRVTPR